MAKGKTVLIDTATQKIYNIGEAMEGGAILTERYAKAISGNNKGRFRLGEPVDEQQERKEQVSSLIRNLSPEQLAELKAAIGATGSQPEVENKQANKDPKGKDPSPKVIKPNVEAKKQPAKGRGRGRKSNAAKK